MSIWSNKDSAALTPESWAECIRSAKEAAERPYEPPPVLVPPWVAAKIGEWRRDTRYDVYGAEFLAACIAAGVDPLNPEDWKL